MKKIHVCVVSQQFTEILSGPGLYTRNLVYRLVASGHHVTLVAPLGTIKDHPNGVEVVNVGARILARRKAGWLILAFLFGRILRKIGKEQVFDIIHFTDAKEALFTVGHRASIIGNVNDPYIASKTINPLFYKTHYPIDWISRWIYLNVVSILERYTLRRLQLCICNSRFTRNVISERYHVPSERLALCYKSIRLESYADVARDCSEDFRQTVLFVGGGNAQRKGLITFLKAANVVSECTTPVRYVVVGRDKVIPVILKKYSSERVSKTLQHILHVPNEDMKQLYAEADLFVMPSLVEAFGVVYLEAMACGTAVIGTTNGGTTELISDRENGLLVHPGDVRKLAELIIEGLTDDSFRLNMVEKGREVVKNYSVEKMIRETLEIYHIVCDNAVDNVV